MNKSKIASRPVGRVVSAVAPVLVDIGARGGADEELLEISWASRFFAFEPEPVEAERLRKKGDPRWKQFKVLPFAVGATVGESDLHIPYGVAGASLLPHDSEAMERFGYPNLHQIRSKVTVMTLTLDELHRLGELNRVDYLKLDIEGPELQVMQAGFSILRSCVALKVECSFLPQRRGQSLTWEVAEFLLRQGFEVVDILDIHRWRRRNLPAHPYRCGFKMQYSRGQVAQCDLIALRSPKELDTTEQGLRLVLLSAALGYFDYAVTVLRDHPEISQFVTETYEVTLEAELRAWSRITGNAVVKAEFCHGLRSLVPLFRSYLGRLPFTNPVDDY